MSESEMERLKNEILSAIGQGVKREVNKGGNKRAGMILVSILGATVWFTHLFGRAASNFGLISDLHRDAIRHEEMVVWIEDTQLRNPTWNPAPVRHTAAPLRF